MGILVQTHHNFNTCYLSDPMRFHVLALRVQLHAELLQAEVKLSTEL